MVGVNGKLPSKIFKGYIGARGFSSSLAMVFALMYSNNLGVERRSIVTLIMASAIVIGLVLTSGVSLAFRKSIKAPNNKLTVSSYVALSSILSLIAAGTTLIFVQIYSNTRTEIPKTLLFIAVIYALLSTLDYCLHQALIAFSLFKLSSILEVLTIVMQISVYSILFFINQVSIAVSLFSAFILSYITSTITMILLLIGILNPSIKIHWNEIKVLLIASWNFHLLGIASSFADRIDRIVIAWFLPLEVLGKYAVGTSFISFLRFLPEAISRWIVSGQNLPIFRKSRKSMPIYIFLTLGSIFLGSILTQVLVKILFGTEWTLPLLVLVFFSAQEIARGLYQIKLSKVIDTDKQRLVRDSSVILIVATPLLSFAGAKIFGEYGVPIGMLISYMIVNLFLRDFPKRFQTHVP